MTDLVALWSSYAESNKWLAAVQQRSGDAFGATVSLARAEARAAAAGLLTASHRPELARSAAKADAGVDRRAGKHSTTKPTGAVS